MDDVPRTLNVHVVTAEVVGDLAVVVVYFAACALILVGAMVTTVITITITELPTINKERVENFLILCQSIF